MGERERARERESKQQKGDSECEQIRGEREVISTVCSAGQ